VLAPSPHTVSQLLRVMGLADEPGFRRYHEVLSRARWDGRAVARRLLLTIVEQLLPDGEVVIGIDDTIERRWGARIKARGIYRDPVRSSKGHFTQDQRPALAVADGGGADPLGQADMGSAVFDDPCPLGALERVGCGTVR
jgi:DDE superfamily endonuclease